MRVIGGKLKSRKLKTLKGDSTRPTSDKVKGAIFSSIAFETNFNVMLDLFAGSGSMGIEALSRGFKFVYLNDLSKDATKVIRANIKDLDLGGVSQITNLDYKSCIKTLSKKSQFDFIFVDPPYGKIDIGDIFKELYNHNSINDLGIVAVESSSKEVLLDRYYDLYKYKEKKYGNSKISYYKKEGSK